MSPPRSVLITGASTGIGYDAAHTLAKRGWRVFATCRREEDCARLRGEGLESFRLDHQDEGSIAAALDEALARTGGTLDAVYANAGFGFPVMIEDLEPAALRDMLETNFVGVHAITRRVLPIMRAQGHGRIVACSSVLGFSAMKLRAPYVASKFALEGYMDVLRLEAKPLGIDAVVIQPGPITSAFRLNAKANFARWVNWESSAHRDIYEAKILPRFDRGLEARDPFELPAAAVSAKLVRALEAPRPKARYMVTTPTYVAHWAMRLLPRRVADWVLSKA